MEEEAKEVPTEEAKEVPVEETKTEEKPPYGLKHHPNDPYHKQVPFPLSGDKNFTMSWAEMKGLINAMEQKEFAKIMNEYVDDISDPKHKAELE